MPKRKNAARHKNADPTSSHAGAELVRRAANLGITYRPLGRHAVPWIDCRRRRELFRTSTTESGLAKVANMLRSYKRRAAARGSARA